MINTATGLVFVAAKDVDLGPFNEGGNAIRVALDIGADKRAITVRMVKAGTSLKY
jgi:hypothetical protein